MLFNISDSMGVRGDNQLNKGRIFRLQSSVVYYSVVMSWPRVVESARQDCKSIESL
jgi:hypothetical protein